MRLELPPGAHTLRVAKEGFEAWEREVHVVPGRTARVKVRLEPQAAVLRVDADVPGANVFLDRKFLGTTPVETRASPMPSSSSSRSTSVSAVLRWKCEQRDMGRRD